MSYQFDDNANNDWVENGWCWSVVMLVASCHKKKSLK